MHIAALMDAQSDAALAVAVVEPRPEAWRWTLIASDLLGEEILLVASKKDLGEARRTWPGIPIYFPAEIRALERNADAPDLIRQMHLAKKHLGAWVVPSDSPRGRWLKENHSC